MANILIADDEKEIIRLLKVYIEAGDHKIFEANNGKVALEILEKESINVEYIYAFVSSKTDEAIVVVKIENYDEISE